MKYHVINLRGIDWHTRRSQNIFGSSNFVSHHVVLQDWNLTWYTPHPDLTQCFQHTVLVWFPCIYLWVCAPLYLVYLWFTDKGRIGLSSLCCAKTVSGCFV